ncbi:nesp044 [Neophasia sp. alphabaculovirus]|nr:nesp044 [Neophasia sp. alphabaculovirus]
MYDLVHETSCINLSKIVASNMLLMASETQRLDVTPFQGSKNRRLAADPAVSLTDTEFYERFDEVNGVYFRLHATTDVIKTLYNGDCVLVFDFGMLKQRKFIINTEENYGFCIARDGVLNISPMSDDMGLSVTNWDNLHYLNKVVFEPSRSEVVVVDNVHLTGTLLCVFVAKHCLSSNLAMQLHQQHILYFVLPPHSSHVV